MLSQFWWQLMIGFRFILDELNPPSTMFCLIVLTNSVYLVFWQGGQEHWEETYDQLYYQRVDMSKDSKCIIIFFDLLLFFCFMSWAAADRMSSSPLSGDIRTFSSKLKFLSPLKCNKNSIWKQKMKMKQKKNSIWEIYVNH